MKTARPETVSTFLATFKSNYAKDGVDQNTVYELELKDSLLTLKSYVDEVVPATVNQVLHVMMRIRCFVTLLVENTKRTQREILEKLAVPGVNEITLDHWNSEFDRALGG